MSVVRFAPNILELLLCLLPQGRAEAGCAGPARRHGRQRRAGLVNIAPIAGNVSVGRDSSTAVPARRFATWLHCCAKRSGSNKAEQGPLLAPAKWQT